MWKISIAAAITLCIAQTACAENLQITNNGETWVAGPESSCWVTLGIENTGAPDTLLVWELILQIAPVDGASGTVTVTDFAKPPDYVLGNDSMGLGPSGASSFGPTFSDMAGDFDNGVDVPSSGKNLLQIQLTSSDAVGRFDIVIVPNDMGTGSNWVSPFFAQYEFDVASVPGRPDRVVASVVFGSVPEPSSGLVLLSGVAVVLLFCSARKRRSCQ